MPSWKAKSVVLIELATLVTLASLATLLQVTFLSCMGMLNVQTRISA